MARKGICSICGRGGKLTEEHIPPQCAGNFRDVKLFAFQDWLDAAGDAYAMQNGQRRPKGTLWVTLCERCNSEVLGSWYVPDFCSFVRGTINSLIRLGEDQIRSISKQPGAWARIKSAGEPIRPLCIVKALVGMILALNGDSDPEFRERHPDLVDFVLNREHPLPPPYRAYLAVHLGDYAAFAPTMFRVRPHDDQVVAFSAIDYPPLAYILTFDEPNPDVEPFLASGGLANFAKVAYTTRGQFEIDLLIGGRNEPIPGEYGQDLGPHSEAIQKRQEPR